MRRFFSSQYGQFILITLSVLASGLAGVAIALYLRGGA